MSNQIVQSVYDHLRKKATSEHLRTLLRSHKEKVSDDVRVTAATKEGLIGNIREAVDAKLIDVTEVYELIRRCEENGGQKIFFFKPTDDEVLSRVSDPDIVRGEIWGDSGAQPSLPNFILEKEKFVWADFRTEHWPGSKVGWRGKLYGHETRWEIVGAPEVEGDRKRVTYIRDDDRPICIVRWVPAGYLEVRIPRTDSIKRANYHFQAAWSFFQKAFLPSDFDDWCLREARMELIRHRMENADVYRLSGAGLFDSAMTGLTIKPHTEFDTIDQAPSTSDALETFLNGEAECRELVVRWLASASKDLDNDLRIAVGSPIASNMISVPRTTTPEAIDYVVDRLRSFDERTS